MSRKVVLAEKPSVARDLARVLKCGRKGNGYFEGGKYIVTWALGHLVTLAEPEAYGEQYKAWNMEDLPMLPPQLKLVVIKQSSKQFGLVKSLMHRKDVGEIIIATDAGREGELVARWIIEKAGVKKPLKRLWISSVTDKAIQDGFTNLRDGREYDNLYASAVARSEADWYVGMNATRALTCKYNAQLSCGRVQSPTLAIIAKREEEIRSFTPRIFYGIAAEAEGLKLTWQDGQTKEIRTFNKDRIDQLVRLIQGKKAVVTEVKKAYKKSYAPKLYDLTQLQRDANKAFGYSAKETMAAMQSLYEYHKVLTYPRTDSRYITTDMVATLKERIRACGRGPYAASASPVLKNSINSDTSFVDNSKVSDHHAIIPTEQPATVGDLREKERKVYDLVVRRFLAVLYPPMEYEQTTITAKIGGETFIAKGKVVIKQGWKAVYEDNVSQEEEAESLSEQALPRLKERDVLRIAAVKRTSGETKPPPLFTEGSLLSAMENPGKHISEGNKDLLKTVKETGGLGTVATRADIIEKLFNSFLIEKKGKDILITSKGRQLLELVPEGLKSPALTGEWEQQLSAIAKGSIRKENFIKFMKDYTKEIVREIKNTRGNFKHDNLTMTRCPECNKFMLEVKGKKGKMLICEDRNCGHRKGVARVTNARCPECRKKMELRGEGEGQIFVCTCGHREKLSSFEKRRKKGGNISKREASNFLREQKKKAEEPINSALADALSKLK